MPRHLHKSRIYSHSKGFSLVELMVALVITLILTAGIAQVFLGSKKSFVIQETLGRMQENGRYAIDSIASDVRRAGYWGGNADISTIVDNTPGGTSNGNSVATDDGTCTDVNWARMLTHRIFGKNDSRANYTCLPSDTTHIGDVLVVRYAAPWVLGGITTPNPPLADHYYIRSSLFEGRLFQGKDIAANTIPGASITRTSELISRAYFIHISDNSDAAKCPGSGAVPSLYRMSLINGALASEEIAYGVDNFQVQYGLDTDGDDSVDSYVDAQAASDTSWGQVIAARIWLSVRAECPESGYDNTNSYAMAGGNYVPGSTDRDGDGNIDGDVDGDGTDDYRRQIFTTTIRLRNQ